MSKISDIQFKHMLLQKRFISLNFTPLYDCAIDAIGDEEGKTVLRLLLREEYPAKGPSHREDLVADLTRIGLTKKQILSEKPTLQTREAIKALYDLLIYEEQFYNIKILVSLRIAEELLVAEEYRYILAELERRYGLKIEDSAFYGPHFLHDKKQKSFGAPDKAESHSDKFNKVLARMIDTKEKCEAAKHYMNAACEARSKFFDQFAL